MVMLAAWLVAAAQPAARGPDHVVPAWYLGIPVVIFAAEASDGLSAPDPLAMKVYVTAPTDPAIGVSPQRVIARADGDRVLPSHQATLTRMPPASAPAPSGGWFVVPGPRAATDTVRSQADPKNSWPGAPLAAAIRIGPAWVPLNNHRVIEHGLARGLLALRPFAGGARMWATVDWEDYTAQRIEPDCGGDATAVEANDPAARDPGPTHAVPGWYLGMPVLLKAMALPAGVDRRSLPRFAVYVHAPVSATAGSAPLKTVQRADGREVILPPHQDTLSEMGSAVDPKLAIGYFVEIGARGDASTVRIQEQPAGSWPNRPLASHIRIGAEWIPVNNHAVIAHGLRAGLLELELFDIGDLMWGEPFEPGSGAALAGIHCRIEPQVALPAIDWSMDLDHLPGQDR